MFGRRRAHPIAGEQRAVPERARRPRLAGVALLVAAVCAAPADADPTQAQRRAIETGVARGVLDAEAALALDSAELIRIVAVFARARGAPASQRADAALARLAGTRFAPARRFARIPAIAGAIDAAGLAVLVADPHVVRISRDAVLTARLAQAVPLVGLDDVHALGLTGSGVRVAIFDTGVDLAHPDLAGAVVGQACFCDDGLPGPAGCCPNGQSQQTGAGAGQDDQGHGTRVAGVVTSAAVHAPLGGAPDAAIVAVKVLNASGTGPGSDFLAGLDWLLQSEPDVSVVNLSFGFGLYPGDCDDADANTMAVAAALDEVRAAGAVIVAGSGNDRSGTGMIAPACISDVVSVGAVWDANVGSQSAFGCTDATTAADQVTCWSNSSTTTDVFAPGGRMTSSRLSGTSITSVGTSYATPVVSACAAALVDGHPDATPDQIADALTVSGVSVVDATNGLAFARLDCLAADTFLRPAQVPALPGGAAWALALLVMAGLGSARLRRRR